MGWYGGDLARLVWTSPATPGRYQPGATDRCSEYSGWRARQARTLNRDDALEDVGPGSSSASASADWSELS